MEHVDVPLEQPILVEIHATNSADEAEGPLRDILVEDDKSIKKLETSLNCEDHLDISLLTDASKSFCDLQIQECPSKVQEEVGTMAVANECIGMNNKESVNELEIQEVVLSLKDCNIHTDNSHSEKEEKGTLFDGQQLLYSGLESPSDIKNDSGQVKYGDEDAPEVFEGSKESVDATVRYETENSEVEGNTKTNQETIECVLPTDVLVTLEQGNGIKTSINKETSVFMGTDEIKSGNNDAEKDIAAGMELSESNLARAEFRQNISSGRSRITSEIPVSSLGVAAKSSKLEEDASTIDGFSVKNVHYCSTEAIATGAEMLTVKQEISEEVLSKDSDFDKGIDCRLDGTTKTNSDLTLSDIERPSVHTYSSSSEEITSMQSHVQYLPTLQKKHTDLGLQPVQEIVKIQHDREQYDRQWQASKQEVPSYVQNRLKLEMVHRTGKEGEINREKGIPHKILPQRARTNEMFTSFPQEIMEERDTSMEKSLLVTRRGDMHHKFTQPGSNSSKSFDKVESVSRRDRGVRKGLLNHEDTMKDRLFPNKGRTLVDRAEAVLEGTMHAENFAPVHTDRNLIYQQGTQGTKGDRVSHNSQFLSRGGNKYDSTNEFNRGQHSHIERAQPTAVGDAMHPELLHSVTRGLFRSEVGQSAPRGELQFQSGQARVQIDEHFESAHQVVRNDDLALTGNPRHSRKFHNKDHTLNVGKGKIGKSVKDNQERFGPVYRSSSSQNETTTDFDELDAKVGSRDYFGPSGGASNSSSSNEASSWRRPSGKGRNISQVAGAPWLDLSSEHVEPQSTKLSSEKRMLICHDRESHIDDSTGWVNPPLHEVQFGKSSMADDRDMVHMTEIPAQGGVKGVGFQSFCPSVENFAPELTFDVGRYSDLPKSKASNIEAEDSDKFVVNFDTKEQKRRIGYINSNRESNGQKIKSNFSSVPSGNMPSVQQNDFFLESGYNHTKQQTVAVKGAAGIAQKNVQVAGSASQPYQSQAASAAKNSSNSIQKQRAIHGLGKSNYKEHLRNNVRDKAYQSPKGAPLYDAQDSVHSDWSDSSSVKPSLELSNSRSGEVIAMKQDQMTGISEANSMQNANVAITHDEYEDSWSSPSFPVNSLPKAKNMEGSSSKSRRWGDVVEEGDEMEFSPLEGKAQQNWEQGMAEGDGRVSDASWRAIQKDVFNMPRKLKHHPETTNSSRRNAPPHKIFFVEHTHRLQNKMVSEDVPSNIPVSGQTPARKSVWERLGPREDAVDFSLSNMPGKQKSAGDGLLMKTPNRSSNSSGANMGNNSYGRHVDHVQETYASKIDYLSIGMGEAEVAVQAYKDDKQRRGKLELYVPRRGLHNF